VTGRLIVFEGGEASGKSTQAARLADRLGAVLTREPGGTAIGEGLRALLLDSVTARLDPRAEALLMAADRAQHVAEVIVPALDAGRHVVSDRFAASSLAYQGHGRGLDLDEVWRLSAFATSGLEADLVILLDVTPNVAEERVARAPDRIETAGEGFHQRVRSGYLELAKAEPDRWVVIDGSQSLEDVTRAVATAVDQHLGALSGESDGA